MTRKISAAAAVILISIAFFGCTAAEQTSPVTKTRTAPAAQSVMPSAEPIETPARVPSAQPQTAKTVCGTEEHSFDYKGKERTYILHIPEGMEPGAPLVFALHGYGSTAAYILLDSSINSVSNEYGFAVVSPQGLSLAYEKETYCWNADLNITNNDDIGFIVALAQYLQQTYDLSAKNTFAMGFSNGGFMCYKLACNAPETFRAVACVSGTMSGRTWERRDPSVFVPILHIHGAEDKTVPIDSKMRAAGGWSGAPPIPEVLKYWADAGNAHDFDEIKISDKVTSLRYSSKDNDNLVWFYRIEGLGHEWPDQDRFGISAADVIWEFFSKYVE